MDLGVDCKTVGRIWNKYQQAQIQLSCESELSQEQIQNLTEPIVNRPYNIQNRKFSIFVQKSGSESIPGFLCAFF